MSLLARAICHLLLFELYLVRRDFPGFYHRVQECPPGNHQAPCDAVARVCSAIDLACLWYPKRVLCLQRSAATVCLLRRYNVSAQLVVGVQQFPFKAHAWVEVGGRVVNDKPYMREIYALLDCC